tara:strand:+ start:420 stop:647 length:228 start_codon:yes stop_codon:yes gene_type:complete
MGRLQMDLPIGNRIVDILQDKIRDLMKEKNKIDNKIAGLERDVYEIQLKQREFNFIAEMEKQTWLEDQLSDIGEN